MIGNVDLFADYLVQSREWAEVIVSYFKLRKFEPLRAYYKRLRARFDAAQVRRKFEGFFPDGETRVAEILRACERLL